jgi:Icc-related predicted phosphoesterase
LETFLKIHLLSDLHLEVNEFKPVGSIVNAADVIVLAGDVHPGVDGFVWARQRFGSKPIVAIAGNHEFFGGDWNKTISEMRAAARDNDVHFLENEAVVIDGVKFLGATLWTDCAFFTESPTWDRVFAEKNFADFHAITVDGEPLTTAHTIARHKESVDWLRTELVKGDPCQQVVVTHHFPHRKSCAPQYLDDRLTVVFGSHVPEDVLSRCGLWLHGHTHSSSNYRVGSGERYTRVICNARGFLWTRGDDDDENPSFDPKLIVESLSDGNWGVAEWRSTDEDWV